MSAVLPTKPGYYWAKWQIATEDTYEGDDLTPAACWEIVQVNDNNGEGAEALSVSVPGVREVQWPDCFVWGALVSELNRPVKVTSHA